MQSLSSNRRDVTNCGSAARARNHVRSASGGRPARGREDIPCARPAACARQFMTTLRRRLDCSAGGRVSCGKGARDCACRCFPFGHRLRAKSGMTRAASAGRLFWPFSPLPSSPLRRQRGKTTLQPKGGGRCCSTCSRPPRPGGSRAAIAQAARTEPEWRDFVAGRKTALTSANLPRHCLSRSQHADVRGCGEAPVTSHPRCRRMDATRGRVPTVHSLFASHLTQRRQVQGWRNMFLSPFHRELKMSPQGGRSSRATRPQHADENRGRAAGLRFLIGGLSEYTRPFARAAWLFAAALPVAGLAAGR